MRDAPTVPSLLKQFAATTFRLSTKSYSPKRYGLHQLDATFTLLPSLLKRPAGLGVGVANCVDGIKQDCNYITVTTCDEDAVAEVISKFITEEIK